MKKTVFIKMLVAVLILGLASFAGAKDIFQSGETNPDFLQWQEARKTKMWMMTSDGNFVGYRPSPVRPKVHQPDKGLTAAPTDPKYDMRDPNSDGNQSDSLLTPVKDQGYCGSCWAFGSYGSTEGFIKSHEAAIYDYSENNLAWLHGGDWGPCDGGNWYLTTAYLARNAGPILEADDPYVVTGPMTLNPPCTDCTPDRYIDDIVHLPARASTSDNAYIKQALVNYGPLVVSYYHDDAYYNATTKTYYQNIETSSNHEVTMVGWDNNKVVPGAPGNGAFIIKNSWGTGWGESGFFYISYYETSVAFNDLGYIIDEQRPVDKVYGYDELSWSDGAWCGGSVWAAAWFTPGENGTLTAVRLWAGDVGTTYEIYIYDDWNGTSFSNQLGTTVTGSFTYPGYYTVDLTTAVPYAINDGFAVVLHYPNSYIPIEQYYSGFTSAATANPGETFLSCDGVGWSDTTVAWDPSASVCLKAITVIEDPPEDIDYGDAPDPTYPTLIASNGASHVIVPGYFLGNGVDSDWDGQPNVNATGDDNNGDDEDGVIFHSLLAPCQTVNTDITASSPGYVDAWIDFNADGDWADSGEKIFASRAVAAGVNALQFTVPCSAERTPTYARFRFSSLGGLSYTGPAQDGEVEDYRVEYVDYCPGATPESTYEYITNVTFAGINNTSDGNSYTDYTDTVAPATVAPGTTETFSVSIVYDPIDPYESVSAFIDWNQDFDFDDTGESYVIASNIGTSGPHTVNVAVPAEATSGTTRMRVVLVWNGIPTPCDSFSWGEVEDYSVEVAVSGKTFRDFNNDGNSDMLWHNTSSGQSLIWMMDGSGGVSTAAYPGGAATVWKPVLTEDYNSDGNEDMVWHNTSTGQIIIWMLDGNGARIATATPGSSSTAWYPVLTGDYNSDGNADIVWHNTSNGQLSIWMMNGAGGKISVILTGNNGLSWKPVLTEDYNSDGNKDIVWYNTSTGQLIIWIMNGAGGKSSIASPGSATSAWTPVITEDYNSDGNADIVWHNPSTGTVSIWLMNGSGGRASAVQPGKAGTAWAPVVGSDYNSDGNADIFWYNSTTGTTYFWMMNGAGGIASGISGTSVNPVWKPVK